MFSIGFGRNDDSQIYKQMRFLKQFFDIFFYSAAKLLVERCRVLDTENNINYCFRLSPD